MPRKKTTDYDNTSITTLKGADRVRKRPAVIFGSDGIDGCQHSVFEILSNSIDEAREGYGKKITVTRYSDGSIEVEDHGRGIPVDYNENEKRYNWELVFCELYAGGKYNNNEGESYEFSLGMNGLGLCSTQYSSEYMDVDIRRDGYRYTLRFEKGEIVGKLKKEPYSKKDTGTKIHWKPDLEVFTDIDIQPEYFLDIMKRQAIVNAGIEFVLLNHNGKPRLKPVTVTISPNISAKWISRLHFQIKCISPNTTTTQAGLNTAALPIRRCGMPLFTRLTAT